MNKVWTMVTCSFVLLAAGCQNGNQASSSGKKDPLPTAVAASLAPSSTPAPTPSPSPSPTPSPSPAPIAKTYKMNKNYDIVPIDPEGNKKVVLLTFDDGPKEKEMIDPLIDVLDKHKAKAIFFVNGYRIKQKPELLKLIHERGQSVGNHSWDHIDLKKESNEKIDSQIGDVSKIVKELTGDAPAFFRPPFGSSNDHVKEKARQDGMLFMTWSNGSLDWDLPSKLDDRGKSDAIIENVMKQLHFGSNILMHELPWTVKTLDELLTKLEEKGYGFVEPCSIETGAAQ